MKRRPWYPSLDDLIFTSDFLGNSELVHLSPEAFRALVLLVCACGFKSVDLQFSEGNGGWLSTDDDRIAAIACVKKSVWKRVKKDVMPFFTVVDDRMRVADERWIRLATGTERPPIPASIRTLVMRRDDFTCTYCGTKEGPFDVDHIVPYSNGGAHTDPENLVCACGRCNREKRARTPEEWISGGEA